jgi:NAD dependent epimerase/dehydratase family enzyme
VNATSPTPVTNAEFTKALGRVLHRPTVLPVPAFAPMVLFGREMVEALLLSSHRILPARLLEAGFEFEHADLDTALADALSSR